MTGPDGEDSGVILMGFMEPVRVGSCGLLSAIVA